MFVVVRTWIGNISKRSSSQSVYTNWLKQSPRRLKILSYLNSTRHQHQLHTLVPRPITVDRIDTLITIKISLATKDSWKVMQFSLRSSIERSSFPVFEFISARRGHRRWNSTPIGRAPERWHRGLARRPIQPRVNSPRLATPTRGGEVSSRDGVARVIAMYQASTRFRVDREFLQSSENT